MCDINSKKSITYDFDSLLEQCVKIHGHLCAGQVLGVRMSMLGLRETGISDPKGKDRKSIIVYVEMDRCATDAVQSVTRCSLGKRSLKFMDYGKMAVTYLNLKTGKAVRIVAREDSRHKAKEYFPEIESGDIIQIISRSMPLMVLFPQNSQNSKNSNKTDPRYIYAALTMSGLLQPSHSYPAS